MLRHILPAALLAAAIAAAAAAEQPIDCRACHGGLLRGVPNLSDYYDNRLGHHPRGRPYPTFNPAYARPGAPREGVAFFDANRNGVLDGEDIRLYGADLLVECSSCHIEHGPGAAVVKIGAYLRMDNRQSALCAACHRY